VPRTRTDGQIRVTPKAKHAGVSRTEPKYRRRVHVGPAAAAPPTKLPCRSNEYETVSGVSDSQHCRIAVVDRSAGVR
jgi:hypothetical protein